MPAPRRVLVFVLTLLVLQLTSCGGGPVVVLTLSVDRTSMMAPADPRALTSTADAVRGMAAILVNDFGLPLPERVTVHRYAGRRAFERGLIDDAQIAPLHAAQLSDFAIGIAVQGQLLLKEDMTDLTGRERLRLIAHELTHVSQIELAGGEGRGEQWLAEGMAEWVAFGALERLGLDAMSRRRAAATSTLGAHGSLIETRLDLESRGTPRGFTLWHTREGSLPTYQLAFLMADHLIGRRGFDRMRGYFGSFARSSDRHANFREAFGWTLAEYETRVLADLRASLGPSAPGAPLVALPPAPLVQAR